MGSLYSIFSSQYNWFRFVSAIFRFVTYVLAHDSFHRSCSHTYEDKILRLQTCCAARLPGNRRGKTTPKLHSRTLHFTNQNPLLHPNKQPSNHTRKHEKLEDNPLWTCQQGKRKHKNKQRNTRQFKQESDNRFNAICSRKSLITLRAIQRCRRLVGRENGL
jgi:hypothetical protein